MFELAVENHVARLTLSRPEARNAVPIGGWSRLAAKAREAEAGGARILIVQGADRAFCAGADLRDFPALVADPAARADFRTAMRDGIDALAELAIPTVALIEGPCFGAGVALALACDMRIGDSGATFAITPAKFGISYPQEDIFRLVSLVGPGQAARLLLTGLAVGAGEAARIGLLDILAPDASAAVEPLILAAVSASGGSHAALKRGLALAVAGVRRDAEQDARFDALFGGEDFARRLSALRPPR